MSNRSVIDTDGNIYKETIEEVTELKASKDVNRFFILDKETYIIRKGFGASFASKG